MDEQNIYYAQSRPEMLPFVPANARYVLDIGCGEGYFASAVKRKTGAEIWGVEMIGQAADAAVPRLDTVLQGTFESVYETLPESYFDCVFFNDVLEHMVDPWDALQKTKRLLRPAGVMVCSLPNVRYFHNLVELLWEKDWRYQTAGILDKTHLRFFTLKSIKQMFKELDFEIVSIKGINQTDSLKFKLANALTFGFINDTRYLQFACVVRPCASNVHRRVNLLTASSHTQAM